MGEAPEELRARIEAKREALGDDLDAIGDRMSPAQIAARKRAEYRFRARHAFDRVRVTVMGQDDDGEPAARPTSPSAGRVATARDKVGDAASTVSDAVQDAPDTLRRQTQGAPIAVGLISFGVGLLVSALLPETEMEQRAVQHVQPQLESLGGELAQAGHEVADQLQEPAHEAVEAVKGSAKQAASSVRDDATDAVSQVKDQATSG